MTENIEKWSRRQVLRHGAVAAAVLVGTAGARRAAQAGGMPTEGLVLHLDAHTVVGAGQPNPSPVSLWKDLSGKGNDVAQPDTALQPRRGAGAGRQRPAVVFDGQDFLDGPPVLPAGTKALTFVAVWERAEAGGSQSVVEQAAPGVGRRASLLTVDGRYGFNGEANDQHSLLPFTPGEFAVSLLRLSDDGAVTLLHNGAKKMGRIDAAKESVGADKIRVGGKVTGGERLHGAIGEILVYDCALDDGQMGRLSSGLCRKWGVKVDTRDPEIVVYEAMLRRNAANPARYTEPYRPQFHYTPVAGWMNDPNGLCFFRDEWHLFFQHHAWGHAVSRDLVHWQHRVPAITPDEHGEIWSGSAVVDRHDTSGFFGGRPGLVCLYTAMSGAENGRQSQSLAYSPDGKTFTKDPKNPVIPQLRYQPGQPDDADFRDPKVFWHEPTKRWIMVVAGGTLRFYSSPNLRDWTFESLNRDIHTECPDLFEMPLDGDPARPQWVLSGAGRWYRLGHFDGHRFAPAGGELPFNYGPDFYAAQTWNDVPDGRRIMIAWQYDWPYQNWPTKPWSGGSMTLPYELTLRTTRAGPRVLSMPVRELAALRGPAQAWAGTSVTSGTNLLGGIAGKTLEIDAEFDVSGTASTFGFKVPKGTAQQTVVGYRPADNRLFVDRRGAGFASIPHFQEIYDAPLPPQNNRVRMRLFLDWGSVEVFGNDGAAVITADIFPDPQRGGLELFADGGDAKLVSLKVSPLQSVWRDSGAHRVR